MNNVVLRKEIRERIEEIEKADIVVGIPSYNNASTIGHVVRVVQIGLAKYFPDRKAVLVNSDGGSTDGTVDIVHNTTIADLQPIFILHRVEPVFKIITPYHGIPGKGSAFRTIFEIAANLDVKACAVIDSDLRSIAPEWIELLLKPVIEGGYDYVAPAYLRHKYDGTITNSIVYPLTSALYGQRVRQPIGGDFGFSGQLAKFYLSKDVWDTDVARFGIDVWMTTTAIGNHFKICQSFLGAKIHDPKDPGTDLSEMLYQVVGSAFDLMEVYAPVWMPVTESVPVPTFGFQYAIALEPVTVNLDRMIEKFKLGVRELMEIWKLFLPADVIAFLYRAEEFDRHEFHMPDEIWVEVIYSFAAAAHKNLLNKAHLLKSLTPLYIGKTASFVIETEDCDAVEVEKKIEKLREAFESGKSFLLYHWKNSV